MSDEELRRVAREIAAETRAAQGLPETVEDPGALAKIVALMRQPTLTGEASDEPSEATREQAS